jgi:hypothetical protein
MMVPQATHCKDSDKKKRMGPWNQTISWAGGTRRGPVKQVSRLWGFFCSC